MEKIETRVKSLLARLNGDEEAVRLEQAGLRWLLGDDHRYLSSLISLHLYTRGIYILHREKSKKWIGSLHH